MNSKASLLKDLCLPLQHHSEEQPATTRTSGRLNFHANPNTLHLIAKHVNKLSLFFALLSPVIFALHRCSQPAAHPTIQLFSQLATHPAI